jgi:3-methyladenine DNA glycosylase AlkD
MGRTESVLTRLRSQANPSSVAGMARFGISTDGALGVSMPVLRAMAKEVGQDHMLALSLWSSGIHEARILAGLIDDPGLVTEAQMEQWVADFDSWDICDQVCSNLFDATPFAYEKAVAWAGRKEEFVKRAGFVLMAALSVHDKKAGNDAFEPFFRLIVQESTDGRNFVKKAINWAVRQIGKRNPLLNARAIAVAQKVQTVDAPSARWIAADALRELTGEKVQSRLKNKKKPSRIKSIQE